MALQTAQKFQSSAACSVIPHRARVLLRPRGCCERIVTYLTRSELSVTFGPPIQPFLARVTGWSCMQCPRCQRDNPVGQKFCGECGKPVTATVTAQEKEARR